MKLFGIEIRRVPEIAPRAAAVMWVTADGERVSIGEMAESHAKHSLALVVRSVRAGKGVVELSNGQLFFGDRELGEARLREKRDDLLVDWPWGDD